MAAHMIQFALVIQHRSSCFAYVYDWVWVRLFLHLYLAFNVRLRETLQSVYHHLVMAVKPTLCILKYHCLRSTNCHFVRHFVTLTRTGTGAGTGPGPAGAAAGACRRLSLAVTESGNRHLNTLNVDLKRNWTLSVSQRQMNNHYNNASTHQSQTSIIQTQFRCFTTSPSSGIGDKELKNEMEDLTDLFVETRDLLADAVSSLQTSG